MITERRGHRGAATGSRRRMLGQMKLVLWDIDGTVLRAGPLAREAFSAALERVLGSHPGDHGVSMSGKTDPQIAEEILATMGVDPAVAADQLPAVLGQMEKELAAAPERLLEQGQVMPGVEALLRRLHAEPGVVQTVLTGNLAANAALKLAAFGLDGWFDLDVGAFGSDHHDRCELVPVARARVAQRYGRLPGDVWVIGDTPNDLACARAADARCLLVATGRIPYSELSALPAEAVWADLSDPDAATALLLD